MGSGICCLEDYIFDKYSQIAQLFTAHLSVLRVKKLLFCILFGNKKYQVLVLMIIFDPSTRFHQKIDLS
jgi:hypothetical protein